MRNLYLALTIGTVFLVLIFGRDARPGLAQTAATLAVVWAILYHAESRRGD